MSTTNKFLVGMFDDDQTLLKAVQSAKESGLKIADAFTPFPVHGLEHKLGLRATKLHTAGFVFGATGLTTAFSLMAFANAVDYPTNFGGKPYFSLPAWIPIMFELTVLFASVGMVIAFYYLCNLYPGKQPKIVDPRLTDDMFALTFDITGDNEQSSKITEFLNKEGAVEVFEKDI
ncbi:MAG: DUF3341 domain-containing protein [Chitinophagales bacterium]|nr:DUF3341 domain-containing protein [Chitinophagales bacterium]MCZ2394516.1 DUF3341 domain-containing protein [Chitinophagales bacterium]